MDAPQLHVFDLADAPPLAAEGVAVLHHAVGAPRLDALRPLHVALVSRALAPDVRAPLAAALMARGVLVVPFDRAPWTLGPAWVRASQALQDGPRPEASPLDADAEHALSATLGALATRPWRVPVYGQALRWTPAGARATQTGDALAEGGPCDWDVPPGVVLRARWDRATLRAVRAQLRRGHLVTLDEALRTDLADDVHAALDTTEAWPYYEVSTGGQFACRCHALMKYGEQPAPVRFLRALLSGARFRRLARLLSGRGCDGRVKVEASWMQPGDFIEPHTDGDGRRELAFVWHLGRDWQPSWGGGLLWLDGGGVVQPAYNRLSLFVVTPRSAHMVKHVSGTAQEKRLGVNGWFGAARAQRYAEPSRWRPLAPGVSSTLSSEAR